MLIQLQILDSIMDFRTHMMEKIQGLVGIHYQLQSNSVALLHRLSDGHAFLDPDLDKVWSPINLSHLYILINLYNILIQPNRQRFTALAIVLAIIACFFSGINSYNLGRKAHTSRCFSLFCGKMVVVICSMLAVAIKDLALRQNNKELPTGKIAVWFEPTSQKKPTSTQALATPTRIGTN